MMKILAIKSAVFGGLGAIGAFVLQLFGGWSDAMTALLVFMVVDYLTGIACAIVQKSPKSACGALDSRAGLKGLLKKGCIMLIVLIAAQLDRLTGTTFIREVAIIGFCANEGLSIVENAGILGLPLPSIIKNTIDALKAKADSQAAGQEGDQE